MKRHNSLPSALRSLLSLAFCLLALLITHRSSLITVAAQSATATLSGTVVDQNGAVIPGVSITVLNAGTSLQREATSNDQGDFVVPLLPPGTYQIRARRDGFAQLEIPNVVLNVGDQKALNIQLKAGDVNATVTVDSNAETVRTDGSVGTVVDRQFVANIPLNGRSLQSLITLTPGVVLAPGGSVGGRDKGMFSVNGQRANANYFTVDGVSANVGNNTGAIFASSQAVGGTLPALTVDGGTNGLVSIDALQEFKIQTSTYAAEFGRQPGGQISLVTRSGTNDFHGSVFEYIRNEAFDANDWFANANRQRRPLERQHDFGGVFGGPLFLPRFGEGGPSFYSGRNRTFFFFSYEGLRLALPKFQLTNVPTLCLRGLGGCGGGQSAGAAALRPILNALPLPNGRDLGNGMAEFSATYGDRSRLNATSLRIDQVVGKRLTLFGRINKAPSSSLARGSAGTGLSDLQHLELDLLTVTIGATYSANSRMGNEVRANYSKNDGKNFFTLDGFGGAVPVARSMLIPSQFDSPTAQSQASFAPFPGASDTSFRAVAIGTSVPADQRQINVIDNFAYIFASHQLKFGVDYRRLTPSLSPTSYAVVGLFFNQAQVISNSASGIVLAMPSAEPVYTSFSLFGQDTWKVSRRLALSLGLRWEVNPPPGERSGDKPLALTEISDLRTTDIAPQGTSLWKTTYNNFAPRVGVAYQLSQTPGRETILRGGFGVFYDVGSNQGSVGFSGFPFRLSRSVALLSYPLDPTQAAPPPFPGLTPPYGGINSFDPNLKLPYTLQWNLAVERSLGLKQTVSASYVGAAGRRLLVQKQLKLAAAAVNPKFTTLNLINNAATSDYDALQVQFQRRLSRGFQALASYTWSHAIDESSSDFADNILTRGNADFDIRHNFTSALVYDIPGVKLNSVADAILRGWSADSRITVQSAFPLNITAGQIIDPTDGTVRNRRASLIQGVPLYLTGSQYPGGRTLNNATPTAAQIAAAGCAPFTPSSPNGKGAFCTPPTGVQGTLGRNVVRGLPAWQVDMALNRRFKLTEKVGLQLRAEAFNLFNHPNFGQIQTSISNVNFGQATNMLGRSLGGLNTLYQVGGPRSFQFALKLAF